MIFTILNKERIFMTTKANEDNGGNSSPITFHTTILQTGQNTAGIEVPEAIIEALGGGKRPLVKVKVNDYSYRSAVAVMGGKFMISFSSDHRAASGLKGGDEVDVTLALDTEPRTVDVPKNLNDALVASGAIEAFEKSAPSMKKEYVRQVMEAKTEETRARRIIKILEKLKGTG
jgi:hypothetical protein